MMTILAITNPAEQPSNGWGGPVAFLVVGIFVYAFYRALPAIQRWTGLGVTDDPSPTPPRAVGSRSNRQVTAGPRRSSDRTEPDGPPAPPRPSGGLRQVWTALRTGNPRAGADDIEDVEEIDETLDEFVARTYQAGDSDGDIIADAVELYDVSEAKVRAALDFVRGEVVRATLGIRQPAIPATPRPDVVDVPLDEEEPQESFEEYVARRRLAGHPYTHIVRDAAGLYDKSEPQVKRQITAVDRERTPGRAA